VELRSIRHSGRPEKRRKAHFRDLSRRFSMGAGGHGDGKTAVPGTGSVNY
jgi:hypothetical protein